ncbi:MAG TPA: hypothetical protein VH518_22165, partial [Tepidisphaeraceae bacterium]
MIPAVVSNAYGQATRETAAAESDDTQISRTELARRSELAIHRGVKYLHSRQNDDGSWTLESPPQTEVGSTAIVTLALLSCGESQQSPSLQKAIKFLKTSKPTRSRYATYSIALRACVYASLPEVMRKEELRNDLRWLQEALIDR